MSDDRLAQARAEAGRRYPMRKGAQLAYTAKQVDLHTAAAFVAGVEWACATYQATGERRE